eukprot:565457-Prymnesium_polylepis.1
MVLGQWLVSSGFGGHGLHWLLLGYCMEAHAAACPQSKDYDNFLAFRHALSAWYFAAPGRDNHGFSPPPPPNPVFKASPDTARCR